MDEGMEDPDTRITHTYTPTRRDGQPYKRPHKPVTLVLMVHEQGDYIENAEPADEDDLRLFGLVRAGATPPSADDPAAVDWFARRYAPEFFKSAEVGADHDWQPEPAPRDSICSHRDANGDICLLPESHHPDRVLSDPAVLERYQELASCFLRVLAEWPGAKGGASA